MQISMRFQGILHPVRTHPATGVKDTGPLHTRDGAMIIYDNWQPQAASAHEQAFHVRARKAGQGFTPTLIHAGAGERRYVFIHGDVTGIRDWIARSETLQAMQSEEKRLETALTDQQEANKRTLEALQAQLQAAETPLADALAAHQETTTTFRHQLVQQYVDTNQDRVHEVPYEVSPRYSVRQFLLAVLTLGFYKPTS